MWYEVLPCLGIMYGAMTLAMYGTQFVPWLALNHRSYRDLKSTHTIHSYHRDERLTGDPYTIQGLDTIPDEDPSQKKT